MAKLDAASRNALPDSAFALPGRRYPIHDASHARAALDDVAKDGSAAEEAIVRHKVAVRYPTIHQDPK